MSESTPATDRSPAEALQVLAPLIGHWNVSGPGHTGTVHLVPGAGGRYRLAAVRAHLLEQSGDLPAALEAYAEAAKRTTSAPEQRYLRNRAARLQ